MPTEQEWPGVKVSQASTVHSVLGTGENGPLNWKLISVLLQGGNDINPTVAWHDQYP